jgi:toxin ParE1/3/4
VFERLLMACHSLADFPHLAAQGRRRGTRELMTVKPYVIVYRVLADTIRIERIMHGAQRR